MDKIQHIFITKTLDKGGTEEPYLTIIKVTYDKHTANVTLNSEKLKSFSLRRVTRQEAHSCHIYSR